MSFGKSLCETHPVTHLCRADTFTEWFGALPWAAANSFYYGRLISRSLQIEVHINL